MLIDPDRGKHQGDKETMRRCCSRIRFNQVWRATLGWWRRKTALWGQIETSNRIKYYPTKVI